MQNSAFAANRYRNGAGPFSLFVFSISAAIAAIFTHEMIFLISLLALSVAAVIIFERGIGGILSVSRYSVALAAFIFLFNLFSLDGKILFKLWFLSATIEGAAAGVLYGLKLMVFAYSGYLIYVAVDSFELVRPLERIGRPLGPLGRPLASAALAFFVAMRFIPELIERGHMTALALRSRGLDHRGGLGRKAKFALYLIPPLISGAIKRADLVAVALDIKGYGARYYRARFGAIQMNPIGICLTVFSAGLMILGFMTA